MTVSVPGVLETTRGGAGHVVPGVDGVPDIPGMTVGGVAGVPGITVSGTPSIPDAITVGGVPGVPGITVSGVPGLPGSPAVARHSVAGLNCPGFGA